MMGYLNYILCAFLPVLGTVLADFELGIGDDSDLFHFVTRPEIKAPRYNVTIYDSSRITPGYWFVAPYANLIQDRMPRNYYQACQSGPNIYDRTGELVWSGACQFRNQNACDFRVWQSNGTGYLSAILHNWQHDPVGRGVLLDQSYQLYHSINLSRVERSLNMHELNVIENGAAVIYVVWRVEWVDTSMLVPFGIDDEAGWVANMGFREIEIATGQVRFEWWALGKVPLTTSSAKIKDLAGPPPMGWNFFHINSVDKNPDGDYMLSARYTDCIYKISGQDGSIIWRLGGDESDFILEGFNFSKQHDARFIEENSTTTLISFLDNGSDGYKSTSRYSSSLLVALETSVVPMTARVVRRWIRPSERLSMLRGNTQLLSSGNVFTGWSDNSHISEHSFDGDLLFEAEYASKRLVTYRSYKFNFTAYPTSPPTLKVFAFGPSPDACVTTCYVSWNGATEVDSWEFYRNDTSPTTLLGKIKKKGFETIFQIVGFHSSIYVQGLSQTGQVLGTSPAQLTVKAQEWQVESEHDEVGVSYDSTMPEQNVIQPRYTEL